MVAFYASLSRDRKPFLRARSGADIGRVNVLHCARARRHRDGAEFRHVRLPDRMPISNLLLTVLHRAGSPVQSIGDSTGECGEV